MSFAATRDATKDQVRQATDLVDLIGGDLPLRRQGSRFTAHCPWHDDQRPSLQIDPARQSWKCWVCNIGGDVFDWVMRREGVDFRQALEMLAQQAGIALPQDKRQPATRPGDPNDKSTLYACTAWAEGQFHQCLAGAPEAEAARRYLDQRGIQAESRQAFRLGYSPDGWQWLLDRSRTSGFSPAVLEAAGLAVRKSDTGRAYDFFRGRLIFPIRDAQRRTIAFGGRVLPGNDDPRKYVNSRDTRLFTKGEHLYGLDLARDAITREQPRQVVIVEGYTDVIMAHQMGLRNVVAVLGTALAATHLRVLRRFADTVTLVLDGDEAGQRRTNEVLELFVAAGVDLRVCTLPAGLDPCDFLHQQGAEPMRQMLATAVDALEHAVNVSTRGIDLLRDTHRANRALETLLALLAKLPRAEGSAASSRLLREQQILSRLAREFRVDESTLRPRIAELRRAAPRRAVEAAAPPQRVSANELDPCDAELIEILACHAELADTALLELQPDDLRTVAARSIFAAYQRIGERGGEMEFEQVLAELTDASLKPLYVELEGRGREKEELACEDAAGRLRQLIARSRERDATRQREAQLDAMEQHRLNDQEELEVLQKLIDLERQRQGITAPTDG